MSTAGEVVGGHHILALHWPKARRAGATRGATYENVCAEQTESPGRNSLPPPSPHLSWTLFATGGRISCDTCDRIPTTLKTLTSLSQECRPFFLGDNSIWSFPIVSSLAITAFGTPGGYLSLAIIAFGVFEFIVPK